MGRQPFVNSNCLQHFIPKCVEFFLADWGFMGENRHDCVGVGHYLSETSTFLKLLQGKSHPQYKEYLFTAGHCIVVLFVFHLSLSPSPTWLIRARCMPL